MHGPREAHLWCHPPLLIVPLMSPINIHTTAYRLCCSCMPPLLVSSWRRLLHPIHHLNACVRYSYGFYVGLPLLRWDPSTHSLQFCTLSTFPSGLVVHREPLRLVHAPCLNWLCLASEGDQSEAPFGIKHLGAWLTGSYYY
jgi:hypothetical protein